MAGGLGMRLRPYTTVLPKPLMPIGHLPILELLLLQLRAAGIRRVIISVNHLAALLQAVIGDGARLGLAVSYQMESEPLGTCGALGYLFDTLPEHFLAINGDLLTNYPFRDLMAMHASSEAVATVATVRKAVTVDFGVLVRDARGEIVDYVEKPQSFKELSIGCYALCREAVRQHLHPGAFCGMPDILKSFLSQGQRVDGLAVECTWIDIGRPDQYQQAQELFENHPDAFLPTASGAPPTPIPV
ncbi:MAG TPA: sugar phosphate nucleotidyltransferase [Pseudorhodoferax sp.]|nr:sugar phosphate nucleotidyltransferase [Pseudorhodoferax sp.]